MIWIDIASWEEYIYIIIWIWDLRNSTFGNPDHKPFTNVRRTFARHAKKATAVGLSVGWDRP